MMGLQGIFRPFWQTVLIALGMGLVTAALILILNRVAWRDGDLSHLASGSLWLSWWPKLIIVAVVIAFLIGWGNRRAARQCREAAPGLTDAELVSAVAAVTRGPIPPEPAVRAAALHFAEKTLVRTRRDPLLLSISTICFVLAFATSVIAGPINLFYAAAVVLFFALAWSRVRSRRRIAARAESMALAVVEPGDTAV
jgi:hypothetical protein